VERLVNPPFLWTFEREASTVLSGSLAWQSMRLEAAIRFALGAVAGVAVGGDAPERSGSENRHDAVRES
jgi:hypothetical protein